MKRPSRPPRLARKAALLLSALFFLACPPAFRFAVEALVWLLTATVEVLFWLLTTVVEMLAWLLTSPASPAILGTALVATLAYCALSALRTSLGWGRS